MPGKSILCTASHCREVVALTGLGTLRINLDQDLVLLDPAASEQHGLNERTEHELSLESWLSLFSEKDQLRLKSAVNSNVRITGAESLKVDLSWAGRTDPTTLEFSFGSEGRDKNIVGACRDVTAAENLEDVRRQRMAAERASQAKSEFMSQVSHELRTPLNAILGFSQLMAMDKEMPLNGMQHERLQVLHQSGLRLLALVDQLLQIGKIEQGKVPLRLRPINVFALVRRCVNALSPMASEHDIAIEIDIFNRELASVRADANALEQVLVNLVSNAIKYNIKGGRVVIRFRSTEAGEISVDDTGAGLTPSQIARLFEPFTRLSPDRSRIQGTGLGLVIAQRLVELMDGTLSVSSEVGVGSRFKLTLPLARGTRTKDDATVSLEMPSQWHTENQFNVLYIEDDEVNIVLMDQLFATQPDWHLKCARTGEEGLIDAVRQRPDVILLDLHLPDVSGREVLKRLKSDRRTRDIPVVAVSADAMAANLRGSKALGFEEYWVKPLDLPATIAKLKSLCLEFGERGYAQL